MALRQQAAKDIAKYEARLATASFVNPTTRGSLVIVTCVAAGALPVGLYGPDGFQLVRVRGLRDLEVAMWYLQNAPPLTRVSVGYEGQTMRSLMVRAYEHSGMAQSNVLDKVMVQTGEGTRFATGTTDTTAQNDELVLALIGNQYGSTTQFGFVGNLQRITETVSPRTWSRGTNEDWERARMTVHQGAATATGKFGLSGQLATSRRWVAIVATFRGGTTGPARFTSLTAPPVLDTNGGGGTLTAFGPLRSLNAPPILTTSGAGASAVMFPFNYQFDLNGLIVGPDTPYDVVSHDGLYGHSMRTADEDRATGDGSDRGVDLQSARQFTITVEVGGTEAETETLLAELYRRCAPQREFDWPMTWRHPGQEPRVVWCRPVDLPRQVNSDNARLAQQSIVFRAADPRHHSAVMRRVTVPVTPAGQDASVVVVGALNLGDALAYPVIRIAGPPTGSEPVTRLQLVNITGDVAFEIAATLGAGASLVARMDGLAASTNEATITIDGDPKYATWQQPREPFYLAPDPVVEHGVNVLYLRTVPEGAAVTCILEYHDTWSG